MPWPVHPNGLLGAQGDNDSYRIERSLRFNSADTAYLSRTPSTTTDRKTWTYSTWIKRANLSSASSIFFGWNGSNTSTVFQFTASDNLELYNYAGAYYAPRLITNQVLRDVSAWYHIILVWDANNSTSSDRQRIYINGQRVTSFSTESYSNDIAYGINVASYPHGIGGGTGSNFDGYMAETNFIDGQALTPSSFGETDAITGRWKAKAYSGTYGTNGFYLKFADNSGTTSTTLGKDSSGNSNNWTPNNFSVTVGAGNDSLVDSPTNYGADSYNITVDNSRGNYNTFNPLSKVTTATLTNGNLDAGASAIAIGSIGMSSGKWYWEITSTGGATAVGMYGVSATSTRSVASGVTEGFRFDSVAGTLDYTVNGSTFTSIATGLTSIPYFIYVSTAAATTASLNCGQRLFSYTMPSGYKALCTTNLTTPTIKKPSSYFDAVTYTGNATGQTISSLGFSPNLVWLKSRSNATYNYLFDTVRGINTFLFSNTTTQDTTTTSLTSFNSNGFTLGADPAPDTSTGFNASGSTQIAWAWDEATIAGLNIVGYQGDGSAGKTVSHNLGVAPKLMIVKNRTTSGFDWVIYHASMNATPQGGYMNLNGTLAYTPNTGIWNNTAPGSSSFTLGTNTAVNKNGDNHIAYLFSEVDGFSKFGIFTGNNNADGTFCWCGFKPKYVMVKKTSATGPWMVFDSSRDVFNVASSELRPNENSAEPISAKGSLDFLSNGFKIRSTSTTYLGELGDFIFVAFAESPFKYARAR